MAQWRITPQEYLERLHLDLDEFKKQLHLPNVENISQIIPLRDIEKVVSLIPINLKMLTYMLKLTKTLDKRMPFTGINLKMVRIDPHHVKIGQKFVYREKYQNLMENIPNLFNQFLVSPGGLSGLGAFFVFGYNGNGAYSLACYLPPIIEKHGSDLLVMDGIHRNYIAKQAGLALNAILVENVNLPFPCSSRDWSDVEIIPNHEKPKELRDRYFDLEEGLFRDLKYLGIDG